MGWGEARGPSEPEKPGLDTLPPDVLEALAAKEKFQHEARRLLRRNAAILVLLLLVIALDVYVLAALPWEPTQIFTLGSLVVLVPMALLTAYQRGMLKELNGSVDRWEEAMDELYMELQAAWIKWMKEQQ